MNVYSDKAVFKNYFREKNLRPNRLESMSREKVVGWWAEYMTRPGMTGRSDDSVISAASHVVGTGHEAFASELTCKNRRASEESR